MMLEESMYKPVMNYVFKYCARVPQSSKFLVGCFENGNPFVNFLLDLMQKQKKKKENKTKHNN